MRCCARKLAFTAWRFLPMNTPAFYLIASPKMAANRKQENALLLALGVLLAISGLDAYLFVRTGLLVFAGLIPFLLVGAAFCFLVFLRLRFAASARDDARDLARQHETGAGNIFEEPADEPFTAARSLRTIETWIVPGFTLAVALAELYFCLGGIQQARDSGSGVRESLLGAAFLTGQGFVCFLLSRFMVGLSRTRNFRLYRGPGIQAGLCAILSFLAAGTSLFMEWTDFEPDRWLAIGFACLLGILGLEKLIQLLLSVYSPRRKTMIATACESRVAALAAAPGEWTRNVAQTVDYQFGIDVAERFHLRILKHALIPLVGMTALALWVMSCFVFLEPHEQGIRERVGKPVNLDTPLNSGLHLKWPWPFEAIRRVPSKRILTVHVGYDPSEHASEEEAAAERARPLIWTEPHHESEHSFLTAVQRQSAALEGTSTNLANRATEVGLIQINLPVEIQVTNLGDYVYAVSDVEDLIKQEALRIVTRQLASRDQVEVLSTERQAFRDAVEAELQAEVQKLQVGVDVLFTGLEAIHPPSEVADAFLAVVSAVEEKEAAILQAKAQAMRIENLGRAEAAEIRLEAQTYATNRVAVATAEARSFTHRLTAYRAAPEVVRERLRLAAFESSFANARKFIVDDSQAAEFLQINLEEKPTIGTLYEPEP